VALLKALSTPHKNSGFDPEGLAGAVDLSDETACIQRIASSGLEIGNVGGPPSVEEHHVKFSEVFCCHRCQGGAETVLFAILAEMDLDDPLSII
jgi:hypothetical protein